MNGMKIGTIGLLDILAAKSGCMYLSDLAKTGTNMMHSESICRKP